MKHFIFSSEDRSDVQSNPQNLFVINYIFMKLHFIWNKPKNVRTFSVPISCSYSVLNQRDCVTEMCRRKCSKYPDNRKSKMGFGEITMEPIMSEMLSVSKIHVKGLKFSELGFLLLVYRQLGFWISMFLLSSSCEKHNFLWVAEGLGGRKLYKPFNDIANLVVQKFILYIFRWE